MFCGVYATTAASDMGSKRVRKQSASEIVFKQRHFLITDRPTDATLDTFIEELNRNKVKDLVRVCDASYSTDRLRELGIHVVDCQFEDGSPPPDAIVSEWFHLLKTCFRERPDSCVAVHCVAGLGRAPVLVALALMELGMSVEEAVDLIRQKRRGAINQKQMEYLQKYRPKARLLLKGSQYSQPKACTIQ